MSRFGDSLGCDWEPWLSPKQLIIRFYLFLKSNTALYFVAAVKARNHHNGVEAMQSYLDRFVDEADLPSF